MKHLEHKKHREHREHLKLLKQLKDKIMIVFTKVIFVVAIAITLATYLFKEIETVLPKKTIIWIRLISFIITVITGLLTFVLS